MVQLQEWGDNHGMVLDQESKTSFIGAIVSMLFD